jgi:hypothetical protein
MTGKCACRHSLTPRSRNRRQSLTFAQKNSPHHRGTNDRGRNHSAASTISDPMTAITTSRIVPNASNPARICAAERLGRTCMSATCSGDYLFSCPTVPRRSSRRSWRLVRRSSRRSWRLVRRSSRRSLRLSRRSWRRSIPGVWASASGAVSTAAGIPMPNAAPSPRIQKALRREIVAASIFSRMANLIWVFSLVASG